MLCWWPSGERYCTHSPHNGATLSPWSDFSPPFLNCRFLYFNQPESYGHLRCTSDFWESEKEVRVCHNANVLDYILRLTGVIISATVWAEFQQWSFEYFYIYIVRVLTKLLFVAEQGIAPTMHAHKVKWQHWHCGEAGGRGSACIHEWAMYIFFS